MQALPITAKIRTRIKGAISVLDLLQN
ncbi:hypothetical protein QZH41_013118 [Actinostola sp. cb2023]|nr:hypothetical protein QZH41_013118 [Actinostola sp. cb2023]